MFQLYVQLLQTIIYNILHPGAIGPIEFIIAVLYGFLVLFLVIGLVILTWYIFYKLPKKLYYRLVKKYDTAIKDLREQLIKHNEGGKLDKCREGKGLILCCAESGYPDECKGIRKVAYDLREKIHILQEKRARFHKWFFIGTILCYLPFIFPLAAIFFDISAPLFMLFIFFASVTFCALSIVDFEFEW